LKVAGSESIMGAGGTMPSYASLNPFFQAFGRLGLLAAEIYAAGFPTATAPTATAENLLSDIANFPQVKQRVCGILALLVLKEVSNNSTDAQTTALRKWSIDLFRSIKVRCAKGVLDEYQKWKANPCMYDGEGYKAPVDCGLGHINTATLFSSYTPPEEILGKAGLKSVFANNADAIASGVAFAASAVAAGVAIGTLGAALGISIVNGAATLTTLCVAFGGEVISKTFAISTTMAASGWAGVVAAPVAAAVLAIVVGTMEGIKVVEAAKVGPMLKMKLGAAITEYININNIMGDTSAAKMFFVAFQEAAQKGFMITPPNVNGEVRFYNQGAYVAQYRLSYTLNGQNQEFTTPSLSVGFEKTYSIPYNATNIKVQGWALTGVSSWKEIFNQSLERPTYICYTSFGTIFGPAAKTDCPELANMVSKPNQLTVTHAGAYIARIKLEYYDQGQNQIIIDRSDLGSGWWKIFDIPATATNVHLVAWSATGLVWEPWKLFYENRWASSPNLCVKISGTTLDPKSNNECK